MIAVTLLLALVVAAMVARKRRLQRREVAAPRVDNGNRPRRKLILLMVAGLLGAQALIGAPALAQNPFGDCKEAPNPERPGSGMVGAIDPTPRGHGEAGSVYEEVGYAGLSWHTYDLGCGPDGVRDPNAVLDTWVGNQFFNVAKNVVGATNGLHYALAEDGMLAPLDDLIVSGTVGLYDSVYAPWFGFIALLLAIVLFRSIWRGDLATVGRRLTWALAGMWLAAATYLTPMLYTEVLDDVLVDGSTEVRTGFLDEVGIESQDALPTLLHDEIIVRNFYRGEFGSPDGPQARELGRDLIRAQAYTKEEIANGADAPGSPVTAQKKAAFEEVAGRAGSAYGYMQGEDGSRAGAGFLAMAQAFMFALFQLLALATLLLAQILLRVVILLGPVIGLIAILYHEILRGVGRAVGAALLNVVMLTALAALHTLVMVWVFDPARGLAVLPQMLLAGLITLVLLMVAKPVRRMWQMVELSVGAVGGAVPSAPPGVLSRMRRRRAGAEPMASERFWSEVAAGEEAVAGSARRNRPEASGPIMARAQRLDRDGPDPTAAGAYRGPTPGGGLGGAGALFTGPGRDGGWTPPALPEGFTSRERRAARMAEPGAVFDSPADVSGWGDEENSLLIPSRTRPRPPGQIRRADMEVVAGRPVYVVYRPSSGLVVDGDPPGMSDRY